MSAQVTRLLVLGVIRLRQPIHGYDIQRELNGWNADQWAGVARPSVYSQLRTLARGGLVAVESVEQVDNRPSRTLYRITELGETEFSRLLKGILWNERPQPLDLLAALCFLPVLTQDEAIEAIEGRMRHIASFLDVFDDQMDLWFQRRENPNYIQEVFFLTREAFVAELRWAEGFLERTRAGAYPFAERSVLN